MQYVPLWTTILRSRKVFNLDDASFRFWVNCLAMAQDHDQRKGTLPDLDSIAFSLRLEDEVAAALMDKLVSGGLIDVVDQTYVIHNWEKWRGKRDPKAAERKREQRNRDRAAVTDVTDVTRDKRDRSDVTGVTHVTAVTRDTECHGIQNRTETEQKAGKPAAPARPPAPTRTHEAVPEVIPIAPKPDAEWEPQPLPDESQTGRSGDDHADFLRAVQILDGHKTTRRLGAELRMQCDTPGVQMLRGWQLVCGAFAVQRPDRNRSWGTLTGFARNATQAEFDKLNAQAPARASPAASLPRLTDEELRAQTEEGNRKVAEYRRRNQL